MGCGVSGGEFRQTGKLPTKDQLIEEYQTTRCRVRNAIVPLADTVAIGDSDNDLTMIEVAGIGIAMGNGEQCAKDAADWVADAVDTSGLAHAFERLGVV